ncbi:arsinothricin resistance N-acetyltransferase ArsN1 family B [Echinimonas agarilytica]|uniref:GNAT family N-acetyltransferase n=1 Tax=Echinimonas agarilytica TaxID=1215918 RepID=A0AA41W607_9GAMM|nr:GNAT family N-acetyltransferase [Echinimonas agarilytica]
MVSIREVQSTDAGAISEIYNYYIHHTVITFEEHEVSADEMKNRFVAVHHQGLPWLVAQHNGDVVGYAYASQWKQRYSFRFSVEVTVYLAPSASGKRIGTALYQSLFDALKATSVHIMIAGITVPNEASVALHEKFGFRKVGHFSEVGFKFEQWLDVGFWQVEMSEVQ